ncbi:MAG: hypothetical protein AVDCRST_MAG80-2576 [uncultured Rubrobacteraceae bacterium]|uniref:Uncharacterized protein n=1 Tax=uncultured Rubrobacteraceae bacterium TaxID=349277 RepID=A0A6J4QVR4_9ACTN|nr:MAG: hypothetical protein AVDCRST_MAG80-2576 [uncultured Rubrobacteraceae bacterium]
MERIVSTWDGVLSIQSRLLTGRDRSFVAGCWRAVTGCRRTPGRLDGARAG